MYLKFVKCYTMFVKCYLKFVKCYTMFVKCCIMFVKWRYNMSSMLQFIEQLRGTPLGNTGVVIFDVTQQR